MTAPATSRLAGLRRVRRIGRGGYGSVFQVIDEGGVARALKVIPVPNDEEAARVARELEACQRVQHPHLIEVLAIEVGAGEARMLMELADGTLDAWLEEPARLPEVWRYLQQAARGVAALHREGMVHRDLKPANLLLVGGVCKVADLGLARGQGLATLTRQGVVMGTPQYMAPEQARGERAGPAADVYALGLVFLRALRGRPRFSKDLSPMDILVRVARGEPPTMTGVRRRWGSSLADELARAFDEDPAARPPDVEAWAASLRLSPRGPAGAPRRASSASAPTPEKERVGGTTVRAMRPSAVITGPGRTTSPRRGNRKLGRPGAVLLGAGLVAGWLVAAPDGDEGPAGPPRRDAAAAHPFDAARLEAMRSELNRAADQRWFRGERRDPGRAPVDAPRLLAADEPTFWPRLRVLPEIQHFYSWMAEGGRPEDLDEPTSRRLRALDREYQDLGFTPPLSPFLQSRPGSRRPLGSIGAAALGLAPEALIEGWLATQVVALEELVAAYRRADLAAPGALPRSVRNAGLLIGAEGVPDDLPLVEFAQGLFDRFGAYGRRLSGLRVHRVIPNHRAAFRVLLAEAERASERMLYAGLRSFAAEEETRDLASRLVLSLRVFRIVPMGRWVSVPSSEVLRWVPGADTPVMWAALRVGFRRARRQYQLGHDPEDDLRAIAEALQRIPPGPDHQVGQDLAHAGLLILLQDLLPARVEELGRARFLRIFWPHAAWDFDRDGAGPGLRRLLAVLAFEGRGADEVEPVVLRTLRREIADYPLPGEGWYERARDALLEREGLAP